MKLAPLVGVGLLALSLPALSLPAQAATRIMTSVPADTYTVTNWYKQSVYDTKDNKIGEIMDVLLDKGGEAKALIIGVGGFLGAGEKDVAVPMGSVKATTKDKKWYLVMDTNKDQLEKAPGFKYDSDKTTWVAENANKK